MGQAGVPMDPLRARMSQVGSQMGHLGHKWVNLGTNGLTWVQIGQLGLKWVKWPWILCSF